jgi:hypothetical protein
MGEKKEINNSNVIKICGFCFGVAIGHHLLSRFLAVGLKNRKTQKMNPMHTK